MLIKHFKVFRWKEPQIGKALLLLLIISIVQVDMKAAKVVITCFLYKWQDTEQIRRQRPSLPCSAPNLSSQINQTKGRERSISPGKGGARSDLLHTYFWQQLLLKCALLAKKGRYCLSRVLKVISQALKKIFYFLSRDSKSTSFFGI